MFNRYAVREITMVSPFLHYLKLYELNNYEKIMLLEGNLQGMQHLGLPVTDLDTSTAFYLNFGFEEALKTEIAPEGETIRVAMLRKDGFTIECYQLPDDERGEIAARKDGHIDHISLNVVDVEKAYTEIKAAGIEILEDDAPVFLPFWEKGVKFFTVRGPDGEKIEFNQRIV